MKTEEARRALLKCGFKLLRTTKHHYQYAYESSGNQVTHIRTRVSKGKRDLRSNEINGMKSQMHLDDGEFRKFMKQVTDGSSKNEFINQQRTTEGKQVKVTVVQFDHEYDVPINSVLAEHVKDFDDTTFVPRGATALYDAVGRTIDTVGKRLSETPESDRPERVFMAIITDGYENASSDYSSETIQEMVKRQTDQYNWNFVFMGADQDAILSAKSLGIGAGQALGFTSNDAGISRARNSLSAYTTRLYSSDVNSQVEFTDEEKDDTVDTSIVRGA